MRAAAQLALVGMLATAVGSTNSCENGCSAGPFVGKTNMNGAYPRSSTMGAAFSTVSADYSGGVRYFDMYSPMLRTRYSQVYWTMMASVPLPASVVAEFAGKTMAISGWESDQVFRGEGGAPDTSVPITWAYNHHYGACTCWCRWCCCCCWCCWCCWC